MLAGLSLSPPQKFPRVFKGGGGGGGEQARELNLLED